VSSLLAFEEIIAIHKGHTKQHDTHIVVKAKTHHGKARKQGFRLPIARKKNNCFATPP
jgi:hypothetical protein